MTRRLSVPPRIVFALCLLLAGLLPVRAQLLVQVKADRADYLPYEAVKLEITLRNNTGTPLIFAEDDPRAFLRFDVSSQKRQLVLALGNLPPNPAAGLILNAGEQKLLRVRLNEHFPLQEEDVYQVQVIAGHPRLDRVYASVPVSFKVNAGVTLWKTEFGVPAESLDAPVRRRQLSLLQFRDGPEGGLALLVEDDRRVYGVERLGPSISGFKPQCELDGNSNIHMLSLFRPRLVQYRVYDFNLRLLQERFLVPTEGSTPALVRDPEIGRVGVTGGRAAVEGRDFRRVEAPAGK
ncbi:MAG: hypothetical protein WC789_14430 [Lentisphaeria bacterium]|jgi:hypothetical protein